MLEITRRIAPVPLSVPDDLRQSIPVGRVRDRRLACFFCALVGASIAKAQEPSSSAPSPEVRVDCPELEQSQLAAIEARHLSELLSQGAARGSLHLVCSSDHVTGSWEEGGAVLDSRTLSRNAGEDAVELLHWLASVLLEMRRERETDRRAPLAEATSVPSTATHEAGEPRSSAGPLETPADEGETMEPSGRGAPAPEASNSGPDSPSGDEEAAATGRLTVDAAVMYAHYGTELVGAFGPRVGLRLALLDRLQLAVLMDGRVGLMPQGTASAGFGMVETAVALGATYSVTPHISFTVAPVFALVFFSAPANLSGPASPGVAGGLSALVRGKLPLGTARPFVDVGIEGAFPPRQVTRSGEPVLTVPTWRAILVLGVELAP